jgi:hypothetical protein
MLNTWKSQEWEWKLLGGKEKDWSADPLVPWPLLQLMLQKMQVKIEFHFLLYLSISFTFFQSLSKVHFFVVQDCSAFPGPSRDERLLLC